jgi:hypothetical protein
VSLLETSDEVANEMFHQSPVDATAWFTDWLRRRDALSANLTAELFAENLETVAAELRSEAHHEATARTQGLMLAAAVLLDTAQGLRQVGEYMTGD